MKRITLPAILVATLVTFQTPIATNATSLDATNHSKPATSSDTSTPAAYDLENEPSECIGFLPKPGCGNEAQDAGEPGGSMQFLVFAIILIGLTAIGIGITRGIKKQQPTKQ